MSVLEDFIDLDEVSGLPSAKGHCGGGDEIDSNNNSHYHSIHHYENAASVEEFDRNFDADEEDDDDDIDFPSLCDLSFDGHGDEEDDVDEEADNECNEELIGDIDGSEGPPRVKAKGGGDAADTSLEGSTGRRSSSLSSGVSSLCDSYSYPIYLRPDILDLLNERARQSP